MGLQEGGRRAQLLGSPQVEGKPPALSPRVPMSSCAESQLEVGSGAPASSPQVPTVPAHQGEEKALFPLWQGAGDKGTEPTSASDHTHIPAAPKVSSVHGTTPRRWLPPPSYILHTASRTLSPDLLCSLEIWSGSHLSLTWTLPLELQTHSHCPVCTR